MLKSSKCKKARQGSIQCHVTPMRFRFLVLSGHIIGLMLLITFNSFLTHAQNDNDIRFDVAITGKIGNGLKDRLEESSALIEEEGESFISMSRVRSLIERDVKNLIAVMRSEGYYAGTVRTSQKGARSDLKIILEVDPGPRYRIEAISLTFENTPTDLDADTIINDHSTLKIKDAARAADIITSETAIELYLPTIGYPLASPKNRRVIIDHATQGARVEYRFDAGPKLVFGEMELTGLKTVRANYLKRQVPWKTGQLYDQNLVDQYRRRLSRSGLFSSINIKNATPDGIELPLTVELKEAKHRTLGLSGSFSTNEGLGTEVLWEHRNFFGAAERLRTTATVAELEQSLSIGLTKPNFLRLEQNLLSELRLERQDNDAFNSKGVNASIGLQRQLTDKLIGFVGFEFDLSNINDGQTDTTFETFGAPITLDWDGSNDLLNPTKGARISLKTTPALIIGVGTFQTLRTELAASTYWAPFQDDRLVLAVRGRAGSIIGAERDELPATRRFFAGGGGSIRGFGYQEVGPLADDGDPIGGRSLATIGFETRFRVSETIGLVPFIEGGNVYEDTLPTFNDFRWGAGLGLRYFTGFGPLRIDVATPLTKRETDATLQIYISLGQSF